MITCIEMKSFILKYASKIMFYDVNIACYHSLNIIFYEFLLFSIYSSPRIQVIKFEKNVPSLEGDIVLIVNH